VTLNKALVITTVNTMFYNIMYTRMCQCAYATVFADYCHSHISFYKHSGSCKFCMYTMLTAESSV